MNIGDAFTPDNWYTPNENFLYAFYKIPLSEDALSQSLDASELGADAYMCGCIVDGEKQPVLFYSGSALKELCEPMVGHTDGLQDFLDTLDDSKYYRQDGSDAVNVGGTLASITMEELG